MTGSALLRPPPARPGYVRVATVEEAVDALAASPGARPLAGGTDLMNQMRLGLRRPDTLVDVDGIAALRRLESDGSTLRIGAGVTIRQLLSSDLVARSLPALIQAGRLLGGRQIQALATVGGNLCNASPAAETATPLLACDAVAVVAGPDRTRSVPLTSLWLGPGQTALTSSELLVEIAVPLHAGDRRSAYRRMELRRSVDIAVVGVSVAVDVADGVVTSARVALGAVAPTPLLAEQAGAALVGAPVAGDTDGGLPPATHASIADAAAACAAAASPIDDARASARYRLAVLDVLVRRACAAVLSAPGRDRLH